MWEGSLVLELAVKTGDGGRWVADPRRLDGELGGAIQRCLLYLSAKGGAESLGVFTIIQMIRMGIISRLWVLENYEAVYLIDPVFEADQSPHRPKQLGRRHSGASAVGDLCRDIQLWLAGSMYSNGFCGLAAQRDA